MNELVLVFVIIDYLQSYHRHILLDLLSLLPIQIVGLVNIQTYKGRIHSIP